MSLVRSQESSRSGLWTHDLLLTRQTPQPLQNVVTSFKLASCVHSIVWNVLLYLFAAYKQWFEEHGGVIVNIIADMWKGFPMMRYGDVILLSWCFILFCPVSKIFKSQSDLGSSIIWNPCTNSLVMAFEVYKINPCSYFRLLTSTSFYFFHKLFT